MAKLVTGLFKTRSSAMLAVEDLMRHGIPQEDISVQMTDTNNGREFFTDIDSKGPEGGVLGVVCGAIIGGVIAALIAMGYIPDSYTGLAGHGVLISTLAGIGLGSLIGLAIGYLIGSSIPEYETDFHQLDRRNGASILVGVYCHERREGEARRLMEASGGKSIRAKSVREEPLRVHTTREYAGSTTSAGTGTGVGTIATDENDRLPPADRI